MAKEWDNRSQSDMNAQIITTDSGRIYRPKNLLNAISEVQQFYVIESKGQNIPSEFLTLERTIDFFRIGVTSGFHFYLFPFVFPKNDLISQLLFGSIPYLVLIVNMAICS